jgi:hypothetical protein
MDEPTWVRTVERIGIAGAVAGYLLLQQGGQISSDREERQQVLAKVIAVVQANTEAMQALASEQRANADAVRLILRLPEAPTPSRRPNP